MKISLGSLSKCNIREVVVMLFVWVLPINTLSDEVSRSLRLKDYDWFNDNNFKMLYECITRTVYRYYEGRTVMIFPDEVSDAFIEAFLVKGINATSAIKKKNKLKSWEAYHKFYLLFPNVNRSNFSYYEDFVYKVEKSSLVLIVWPPNTTMEEVSKVHQKFWQFRLIKVASFIQERTSDVGVYVYIPFNNKRCGDGATAYRVDTCTPNGFLNNYDVYSGITRLTNFHGCTLNVVVNIQYPDCYLEDLRNGSWAVRGNINYMLNAFRDHYNVSFAFYNLFNLTFNWYYYNTSLEATMRQHENESYEFGVGAFSLMTRNDNPFIEYTFGPNPECLAWAVPSFAGERPSIWMTLVSEFPIVVWCLLGTAIVVGTAFVSSSKYVEDNNLSTIRVIRISLMMVFAMTSESPKMKFRFRSPNVYLFGWCLCGLVIRCAYEASLGSLLTLTVPAQQLKSNKELLERNFRIAGGVQMYTFLEEAATRDEVLKKLMKRFEILPPMDGREMRKRIILHKNLAIVQPDHYTYVVATRAAAHFKTSSGITSIKPCLLKTFSSPMIIRKGSFMSDLLTAFSTHIFETGLGQYWKSLETSVPIWEPSQTRGEPLHLDKLRGAFIFYFTGITISTIVFGFEMLKSQSGQ